MLLVCGNSCPVFIINVAILDLNILLIIVNIINIVNNNYLSNYIIEYLFHIYFLAKNIKSKSRLLSEDLEI